MTTRFHLSFDLCPVNALPTFGDLSKVFIPNPRMLPEMLLQKVFGMTWRFLPVCDPLVSVTMSRDLDSRLTSRFYRIVVGFSTFGYLMLGLLIL